jgi:hypothetical protein
MIKYLNNVRLYEDHIKIYHVVLFVVTLKHQIQFAKFNINSL